jgi:hypothetical protein
MVTKWVREEQDRPEEYAINQAVPRGMAKQSTMGGHSLDSDASMSFTVYNAIGGKVIEFRRYDRQRDRSDHQVYVIGQDQDFGERIAKIATMESLKH